MKTNKLFQNKQYFIILFLFFLFITLVFAYKGIKEQEGEEIKTLPIESIEPKPTLKPAYSIKPVPISSPIVESPIPSFKEPGDDNYILQYSEGSCSSDSQCIFAEYGCNNGQGMCTTTPEKYRDIVTTCVYNQDFPVLSGYQCQCIDSLGKCGWVK